MVSGSHTRARVAVAGAGLMVVAALLLAPGVAIAQTPPSITVSPTSVPAGGTVTVVVANGPGATRDWIGLHLTSASDSTYLDWKYLNGLRTAPASGMTSATVTFTMPSTPGSYNLRFFANNTFTRLATSATVTVGPQTPPSITVSPTSVPAGGAVTVVVANGPGATRDWIGLHIEGALDTASVDWKYLNGLQSAPANGMTTATLTFTMPSTPGSYNLRFFANDTFTRLATSATVTVEPMITVMPTIVGVGGAVTVTIANGPGSPSDWIGLHVDSAGDSAYLDWKYLNGLRTPPATGLTAATTTFTMPTTLGTYNLRLFANDTFVKLGTSATITVTADATPPVVSGVSVSGITSSGATIVWTTNEVSDSQVEYGPTTAYSRASAVDVNPVTAHVVTLPGLAPNTLYHFRARSQDAAGNLRVSGDFTFTTLPDLDTTPPSVSVTLPVAGATVSGTVTVAAVATDNVGVAGVQFRLDAAALGGEDTASPHAISWNTTAATNGVHTLTAVARDAAGNQTTSAPVSVTVANDTTAPVISQVTASSITASTTTISWTTDEASDSEVEYGPTTAYGSVTPLNASLVTQHAMTLTGLTGSTWYHVRVRSQNAAGLLAVSGDVTFTTRAAPDTTPPVVSNVTAGSISSSGAAISWMTDEASDSQVEYGLTAAYGSTSPLNASLVTAHAAALSGLTDATLYHYRVRSRDAAGNLATSGDVTFTTLAVPDTTPPVISGVTASSVLYSTATSAWTTNEASDSQIEYGPTTAYGSVSTLDVNLVTAHTITLSTLTPNTLYHFRARSRDAAGNLGVSGDFTMTTLEATAPSVSITAPASGASVAGTIAVTANASDNVGVVGVQFRLDGAPLGVEDTTAPYAVSWNTIVATQGLHTLTAVARDAAGNQTTSSAVTVTAANAEVEVTLEWDPSTDPDLAGYKIYFGTASGLYSVNIDVRNVTSCTITGLQAGTSYYFAATAYDSHGVESGFSNEVNAVK